MLFHSRVPDIASKILQISRVSLDGMRRSIALPQHAQKLVRGLLDRGALVIDSFVHIVTRKSFHHRVTETRRKTNSFSFESRTSYVSRTP